MSLTLYDPLPSRNEYGSFFFNALRQYSATHGTTIYELASLNPLPSNCTVLILTDYLDEALIVGLKNNGCKIIGLNVTDSSYISQGIRYAKSLPMVDLIFMVSGIPNTNDGSEIAVDKDFNITTVDKPFLDEEHWKIFDRMHRSGRLHSLPYVPWTPIPSTAWKSWEDRSKKALIRGGGHSRRFILALFLMRVDRLDTNSGMVLGPYFADNMNPAFRYCDDCRHVYKQMGGKAVYIPGAGALGCNGPHVVDHWTWTFSDLGQWNNRCPRSFYWMAEEFQKCYGPVPMDEVEKMLNARWLHPQEHMDILGRMLFTADLKWTHSIYAPQRFWEGAAAGAINFLPSRTNKQDYFPAMRDGEHFLTYYESFEFLHESTELEKHHYEHISSSALKLYNAWIRPTEFPINTNLLKHIMEEVNKR